ncbi:MAG: PAS domain S-box protein [Magnetococcales bacterium]|nr:PAS domain S-box protein [Magnetococcales bacterium]
MTINTRLAGFGMGLFAVVVLVGYAALERLHTLSGLTGQIYHQPYLVTNAVMRLRDQATRMHLDVMEMLHELMGVDAVAVRLEGLEAEMRVELRVIQERYPGDPVDVRALHDAVVGWSALCRDIVTAQRDRGGQAAFRMMGLEHEPRWQRVSASSETLLQRVHHQAGVLQERAEEEMQLIFRVGGGVVLVIFGGGIWLAWLLTRRLHVSELARRHTQSAFLEQATLLENLVLTATDLAIGATDEILVVRICNPAAERMFGVRMEEVVGHTVWEVADRFGVQRARVDTLLGRVAKLGAELFETRHATAQGERIYEVRISSILDRSRRNVGYQFLARDVTEARNAAMRLARSEEKFRMLMESARDAILVADAESGLILDANRMAATLLQRPVTELIGMHQSQLHPPEERERYRETFHAQVLAGGGFVTNVCVINSLGARIPVEINAGVIRLGEQRVIQGIFRDVTERQQAEQALRWAMDSLTVEIAERKRVEEALRQLNDSLEKRVAERTLELERSNRDLQQFAHVASHDLQEPLRQVSGFAQLLARRYQGQLDAKAEQFIDYMVEGTQHMQELIEALLSFSRVQTHGGPLAEISCERVLDQVMRNLATAIAQSGATITRDRLPDIRADSFQLVRMFQNLISNAIKFRGAELPRIHVGVEEIEGFWRFSVRDNGIGIAERHRERIFIIFQRLHTRATHPGTGIGLAICKRIAERHGGTIWVESEPGQGSVFYFTIQRL